MPKYYFLYRNKTIAPDTVFQSDHTDDTEEAIKEYFSRHYNAEIIAIRKGREFSKSEINKKKKQLRYA